MHGVSTGEVYPYQVELAVMRDMGWSWDDLRAAPYDLVEVALIEMNARNKWSRKKQEFDEQRR